VIKPGGGTLGSVACDGLVPKTIRQLNRKQRVIKPVARGLNIGALMKALFTHADKAFVYMRYGLSLNDNR
jgi:hypothetical protein